MTRPQAPPVRTQRWVDGEWRQAGDLLAAEEPLQLSLDGEPLSIVMRTPGNDLELALGLLWSEGVITALDQVARVRISAEAGETEPGLALEPDLVESNQVDVHLAGRPGRRPQRSFLSSSACGVCGATTLESLALDFPPVAPGPAVDARQVEVEEQEVDVKRAHALERLGAIPGPVDGMAGRLEDVANQFEVERIVLGDQDRGHAAQYSDARFL